MFKTFGSLLPIRTNNLPVMQVGKKTDDFPDKKNGNL